MQISSEKATPEANTAQYFVFLLLIEHTERKKAVARFHRMFCVNIQVSSTTVLLLLKIRKIIWAVVLKETLYQQTTVILLTVFGEA